MYSVFPLKFSPPPVQSVWKSARLTIIKQVWQQLSGGESSRKTLSLTDSPEELTQEMKKTDGRMGLPRHGKAPVSESQYASLPSSGTNTSLLTEPHLSKIPLTAISKSAALNQRRTICHRAAASGQKRLVQQQLCERQHMLQTDLSHTLHGAHKTPVTRLVLHVCESRDCYTYISLWYARSPIAETLKYIRWHKLRLLANIKSHRSC